LKAGAALKSLTEGCKLEPESASIANAAGRSIDAVLSTLVHEMVHLWQAYHNKGWAAQMKAVGLQPSDTGAPGGKETGQKMTHYITEGGAFARATAALLGAGFALSWADAAMFGSDQSKSKKSGSRVKFTCPGCQVNAWGKAGLKLICGECAQLMEGDEPEEDDE